MLRDMYFRRKYACFCFLIAGRERVEIKANVKTLRDMREYLIKKILSKATDISDILLEEEAISVDDYDAINQIEIYSCRTEKLLDTLISNGSDLALEAFFFALRHTMCHIKWETTQTFPSDPNKDKVIRERSLQTMEGNGKLSFVITCLF